ncbi:hypothetical protein V8G54_008301 [Vigna mungo]|uniref:Uncharacterized protein n=1 Tax=Vigna mungo TaxID=3915 RepID=A0AAQ3S6A3_VIGMU
MYLIQKLNQDISRRAHSEIGDIDESGDFLILISDKIGPYFTYGHPWVQVGGVAPDKPLDSAVLSRLKQFSAMNKLKKIAIRIIAESLSEEEIAGLKEMLRMIDR